MENSPSNILSSRAPVDKSGKTGFRHTSLGWIPEEWEVKNLGDLTVKVGSGITPTGGEKVYKKSGRPFIRSQNVGWGQLILDDVVFLDEETHKTFLSTELQLNDVLLNITGASIGRIAVADERVIKGNVNQHVCVIRTDGKLVSKYLSFFLSSAKGQNLINSYQAGGNRQGLNFEQIKSFPIPLPKKIEQKKIAAILSTWDEAITKTQQLIAQLQQRNKGLMQQLLTGAKRLKGFSEGWEMVILGDLGKFLKGAGISKSEVKEIGLPAIRYGEIYTQHHYTIEKFHSYIDDFSASISKPIQKGDLLFAGSGETLEEIGKCVAYNFDVIAYAGGDIIIFRPEQKLCERFLGYLLNSEEINSQKESFGKGHSVVHIYPKDLVKLKLRLPKLDEQKAIAHLLDNAASELKISRQKLAFLQQQKKGLMQKLLTGEIRVKLKLK